MSLLAPWFLAGLALLAGPVVAHLIRRATRNRVEFSALRFLNPSPPRLDRRSKIEHPWLLLLRCLIIAVLALGFARPYLKQSAAVAPTASLPKSVVVLLDRSASMQRPALWPEATARVLALTEDLSPQDTFTLLAFSDAPVTLISPEQWAQTPLNERDALVEVVLETTTPNWSITALDNAMETALELVREINEVQGGSSAMEIIVVSDLTAGTRLAGMAGLNWPDNCQVRLERIAPPDPVGNFGLQWLGWGADIGEGAPARVRVTGDEHTATSRVTLEVRDAVSDQPVGEPTSIVLPAAGTQVALLPVGNQAPESLRIQLSGTDPAFDNTLWVVRDLPRSLSLQIFGSASAGDPQASRFYIESATTGWVDPTPAWHSEETPLSPAPDSSLTIVTDPLEANSLTSLQTRLSNGGFVLVLVDDPNMTATAAALTGESNLSPASPAAAGEPLLFGQIDFEHPLFAPFADPHYSDFTRVRFWRPQSLALPENSGATVVARFDNGQPAVIESPVGEGRVIVWASGWAPDDSQWVLSTKFVPWLQALAERAVGGVALPAVTELGDLSRLNLGSSSGLRLASTNETATPGNLAPGLYTMDSATGGPRTVALNTPATESRTDSLSLEAFEDLGVPLENLESTSLVPGNVDQQAAESAVITERRQQAWRWFLILAALLLAAEGVLSLRLSRRASQPSTASAT